MIASLTGTVTAIQLTGAVIEAGGVGYFFTATPRTLGHLSRGEKATVLTTMVVRDDAISLYGFDDDADREIFSTLQTVTGLGPRLALACLSVFNAHEIAQAVAAEDMKALQRIPGVGKKVAQRMIVELKDKMKAYVAGLGQSEESAAPTLPLTGSAVEADVVEALIGLGFTEKQSAPAVSAVVAENPELGTAELLRAALAYLGKSR